MLVDVGCRYVLVGHSERRQYHAETSEDVARKFFAAKRAGLIPILCVGETLHQREAGQTEWAIERQLAPVLATAGAQAFDKAVLAYEPVWAIGTGRTATPEQAQAGPCLHPWRSARPWMLKLRARCRSFTAAA